MTKNLLDLDRVPTIEELCEFFRENDFSTATLSADVFEQVSIKLIEETFWSKLTEDDKTILLMRMDGKNQKEIAEKLGYKSHSELPKDLFLRLTGG